MSAVHPLPHPPELHVDYVDAASLDAQLARDDTLAVFGFGDAAPASADPRYLRVPLQPHGEPASAVDLDQVIGLRIAPGACHLFDGAGARLEVRQAASGRPRLGVVR